jgi:tRNA threonylcarbamoyladenosine biosynthesis protein TsaE
VSSAEKQLATASPAETHALGAALGALLAAGDVVLLSGELGAGKTAFVQGLARGFGVPAERRVASPSFTLVNEHTGRAPLYHIDLYRIEDPSELEEIGMRDYFAGRGVAVVEWAERLDRFVPADRLEITIMITGAESRSFSVRSVGPRSQAILVGWRG